MPEFRMKHWGYETIVNSVFKITYFKNKKYIILRNIKTPVTVFSASY